MQSQKFTKSCSYLGSRADFSVGIMCAYCQSTKKGLHSDTATQWNILSVVIFNDLTDITNTAIIIDIVNTRMSSLSCTEWNWPKTIFISTRMTSVAIQTKYNPCMYKQLCFFGATLPLTHLNKINSTYLFENLPYFFHLVKISSVYITCTFNNSSLTVPVNARTNQKNPK